MLHSKTILRRHASPLRPGHRRASVLILVVALLVLMALIATALIGNVRSDRYTSVQNANNTQVDLLLEGVKNMTIAKIVDALYNKNAVVGTVSYRAEADGGTYGAFTGPEVGVGETSGAFPAANNQWLASGTPDVSDATAAPTVGGAANSISWGALTNPIIGSVFESPIPAAGVTQYTMRAHVQPTAYPSLAAPKYPALIRNDSLPGLAFTPSGGPFVAADADGDGIADSGLVKLPVGDLNGLTYYAGVRIIDNARAINLNTAWTAQHEFDYQGNEVSAPTPDPVGLFRSNVGLAEFLRSEVVNANPVAAQNGTYDPSRGLGAEIDALNLYRWTGYVASASKQGPVLADVPVGLEGDTARPVLMDRDAGGAAGQPRADFTFVNISDAVEQQLARRIDYPGYGAGSGTSPKLHAFAISDQLSLAYHFSCSNAYTDTSPTQLEQLMDFAVGGSGAQKVSSIYNRSNASGNDGVLPSKAYGLSDIGLWYTQHFDFAAEVIGDSSGVAANSLTFKNRRTQLTLFSKTSNFTSPRTTTLTPEAPLRLEMRPYAPYNRSVAPTVAHLAGQQPVAPRTSINTATFAELWRAYWSVMTDPGGLAPYNHGFDPIAGLDGVDDNDPSTPPSYRYPHDTAQLPTVAHDYTKLYTGSTFPVPAVGSPQDASAFEPTRESTPNPQNVMRMFRSSLRDNRAGTVNAANLALRYAPSDQIQLRSAIAANNAVWMRDPDQRDPATNSNARAAKLLFDALENGAAIPTQVELFPVSLQPFITEVFASGDQGTYGGFTNPNGYFAMELYNPYPVAITLDDTYKIVIIDRHRTAAFTPGTGGRTIKIIASFPAAGVILDPGAYFVIDSMDLANPLAYRSAGVTSVDVPATGAMAPPVGISFPKLLSTTPADGAFDNEIQIVRVPEVGTLRSKNISSTAPPYTIPSSDTDTIMPLDSFDLTGFNSTSTLPPGPPISDTAPQVWHYNRATTSYFGRWTCVYPGRYDGSLDERRQQGTQAFTYTVAAVEPTIAGLGATFGAGSATSSYGTLIPIQLMNVGATGNQIKNGNNKFPFGGFARNGDILQVPFISAYRVRDAAGNLLELNSVTMDASFAEDSDPGDDASSLSSEIQEKQFWRESVGRCVPIIDEEAAGSLSFIVDSKPESSGGPNTNMNRDNISQTLGPGREWLHRYHWATRLFDYLTVQNPHDDYLPNASPGIYDAFNGSTHVEPTQNSYGPPATETTYGSITPTNNRGIEDYVPIDGLINLNTASWRVLATLPWMPPGSSRNTTNEVFNAGSMTDNELIAKAIVQCRDGVRLLPQATYPDFPVGNSADDLTDGPPGGPFRSIYDIYRVKGIRILTARAYNRTFQADENAGDLYLGSPLDDSYYDFEERTMLINRVSNLVTIRSDAFTAYIVLEGWRNAGTARAERVVQRRAAFLIDRSGVTPTNPKVKTVNIPTE